MNAPARPPKPCAPPSPRCSTGCRPKQAAQAVERLIANYRGRTPTDTPDPARPRGRRRLRRVPDARHLRGGARRRWTAFADAAPGWAPGSHLDVGGGTGAATWAVERDLATATAPVTVLDWAEPALALGRELAAAEPGPARRPLAARPDRLRTLTLEPADLVTVSYVLNELTAADRAAARGRRRGAAQAVVIVEPGTPDGYARVIEARDRLIARRLPRRRALPAQRGLPDRARQDWCHFSARVSRSSLHRQVKGGSLPYEDEKFSYVAADPPPASPRPPPASSASPQIRKGQVLLDLCEPDER